MQDDAEGQHSVRRRRRRSRGAGRHHSEKGLAYLQGKRFGRRVFGGMVAATLVYGGVMLYQVCGAGGVMAVVKLGMSQQDVRYRLGAPHQSTIA